MSKILTNTVKKTAVWAVVLTYILVAAVAFGIIFGAKGYGVFNKGAVLDNTNTLTISMNQHAYLTKLDTVEDACEDVFADLEVSYQMKGEMTGDESEIVYVFDEDVNLAKVETQLEAKIAELQKDSLDGTFITVATNKLETVEFLAKDYAIRGAIAAIVMVVLVYIYAAIRFGIGKGVLAAIGTLYAMGLTAAVMVFTRIPVTASVSYVFATAGLLGAVASMLSLNKIKSTEKMTGADELYADELVSSSLAKKEIVPVCLVSCAALVVLALIAPTNVKWFALAAMVGVIAATIVGLIYVPSLYILVKAAADRKPKAGYVGAKKTSTKVKKTFVKAAAPAKPVVEEPVVEEPVVEEPVVEEPAVEEPAVEEPAVEEPVVEEPAVEEPAVEEPAVEEPAVEEPVVEEPVVEEPAVEEPAEEDKE